MATLLSYLSPEGWEGSVQMVIAACVRCFPAGRGSYHRLSKKSQRFDYLSLREAAGCAFCQQRPFAKLSSQPDCHLLVQCVDHACERKGSPNQERANSKVPVVLSVKLGENREHCDIIFRVFLVRCCHIE